MPSRFQVALSFAGNDRKFANKIARKLKPYGLDVFLDSDRLAELAGEDSEKLREIYGRRTDVVVPIISEHYLKSDFTQVEFEAALEAEKRGEAKLVPIRLDDTCQFGLRSDKFFLDPSQYTLKSIAEAIAAKCGVDLSTASDSIASKTPPRSFPVLSASARKALGLIAYSRFPFTAENFEKLLPNLNWKKLLKELEQAQLIKFENGLVQADNDSKKTILSDVDEKNSFRQIWKEALEPIRFHMDMALELALIYMDEGNFEGGVQLLVDVANGVDIGYWNNVYVSTFETILETKKYRRLSGQLRMELLHALGKCLAHSGRIDEALSVLKRAKNLAKRKRDDSWLGHILSTTGVIHHNNGSKDKAFRFYEEAVIVASRSEDQLLLGRALGNLASLKQDESPFLAKSLLKRSVAAKKAAKDELGVVVATFQLGNIEATSGRPGFAIVQYEKCLELKKGLETESDPEDALVFHNLAKAHAECGHQSKATKHFLKSIHEARRIGLKDIESMALVGLGSVHFALKKYSELEQVSNELWDIAIEDGHVIHQLCAKHGAGVSQILTGDEEGGRKSIKAALRIARSENELDWAVRCLVDLTRPVENNELGEMNLSKVKEAAASEKRKGNSQIAAALWVRVANQIHKSKGEPNHEKAALDHAWTLLEDAESVHEDLIYSLKQIHHGLWRSQEFDEALTVHAKLEDISTGIAGIEFKNSRGCLLMEIDRHCEAKTVFTELIKEVRKLDSPEALSMVLNNLGECFRQQGEHEKAETIFKESESISAKLGNFEGEIATAHNRALAYQNDGDFVRAAKLFELCRDKAARRKYWGEYVRAWEALAGVASQQGKEGVTKNRYERALKEAKKHKCNDNLARTALNYSNWLYHQGDAKTGLSLLKKYTSKFDHFPDAHVYYFAIGLCQEDLQQLPEAVETFKIARKRAALFGDDYYVAACTSHVVEIGIFEANHIAELRDEVEPFLEIVDNPAEQLVLLECLLKIEIRCDDDSKSQEVYDRAKLIVEGNEVPYGLIDLNLVIAEHDWRSGEHDQRIQAMRIWADAFANAVVHDIDLEDVESSDDELDDEWEFDDDSMASTVIGPIFAKLTLPPDNPTPEEFDKLVEDVRQLLYKEHGSSKKTKETIEFMLGPFDMVKRLLPYAGKPRRQLRELDSFLSES